MARDLNLNDCGSTQTEIQKTRNSLKKMKKSLTVKENNAKQQQKLRDKTQTKDLETNHF